MTEEFREIPSASGEAVLIKKVPPERTCFIGAPEVFVLDHVCSVVSDALGETCYLVGSATQTREFRDVDVRMVFDDKKWELLFGTHKTGGQCIAFWSLLCTSVSEYMSKRTGLKIDFQIQRRGSVGESDWAKVRSPLGLFYSNVGPAWRDARGT